MAYKIAVFVSGRGSNLKALLNSDDLYEIVKVEAVVSNKVDCGAFTIANEFNIDKYVIGKQGISYSELAAVFDEKKIDLIVLAGFLKLIPADFIEKFENRIINIHPALLPAFGGNGMYGSNVHTAVYNSSAKISGCSVHFVNNEFDSGLIIAQKSVDISMVKSPDEIAEKVLEQEHILLTEVIKGFALNKFKIVNNRVEYTF